MKKISVLFLCLALVLTMTACAANATPAPTPSLLPSTPAVPTPMPGATNPNPNETSPHPSATDGAMITSAMTPTESVALSKKANDAAAKISEIDSCVTAIIGNTCIAGVTFTSQYRGALTDRISDMVSSRIQSAAPAVERVAVTNDPELTAQISAIAAKIGSSNALGDLAGEMDSILARIQG